MSASTVDIGAYAAFIYTRQFTATEIDLVYGGKIPTSTTSTAGNWTRLFVSDQGGASLDITGTTVDLKTLEEGLKSIVLTQPDKWTFKSGLASVDSTSFKRILQVNPVTAGSSGTSTPLNSNFTGTNLLTNGFPLMIVHKSYQNNSTNTSLDVPVFTDPNSWVFTLASIGERKVTVSYDPTKQQIMDATLTMVNQNGTVNSNVLGYYGSITPSSSI